MKECSSYIDLITEQQVMLVKHAIVLLEVSQGC